MASLLLANVNAAPIVPELSNFRLLDFPVEVRFKVTLISSHLAGGMRAMTETSPNLETVAQRAQEARGTNCTMASERYVEQCPPLS